MAGQHPSIAQDQVLLISPDQESQRLVVFNQGSPTTRVEGRAVTLEGRPCHSDGTTLMAVSPTGKTRVGKFDRLPALYVGAQVVDVATTPGWKGTINRVSPPSVDFRSE